MGDIDFNGGFLEVSRAVVMGKETMTKSNKIRRVDMSRQLQEELKGVKEIRQTEAMNNGQDLAPSVLLFSEGVRWNERKFQAWMVSMFREGGGFHDRHRFVSLLIDQAN